MYIYTYYLGDWVFDPEDYEIITDKDGNEIKILEDRFEGLILVFLIFTGILWCMVREPPSKDQILLEKQSKIINHFYLLNYKEEGEEMQDIQEIKGKLK